MAGRGSPRAAREARHTRIRERVKGTGLRPRLGVFRSLNHVYAQIIDDSQRHTLAQASTLDPEIKAEVQGRTKTSAAELVGSLIANRASAKGIMQVVFDRGGYKYHGRIKALAEAARKAGLQF